MLAQNYEPGLFDKLGKQQTCLSKEDTWKRKKKGIVTALKERLIIVSIGENP